MSKRLPFAIVVATVSVLSLSGMCFGCLWWIQEHPRFEYEFDIGEGRTLAVWSIRRDAGFDPDPNPYMVYYRVDGGQRDGIDTFWLDYDDDGDYEFRKVTADNGRLVCIYEVTRAADNYSLMMIYDTDKNESWPATWERQGISIDRAVAKWKERYLRIQAENPDMPTCKSFVEKVANP